MTTKQYNKLVRLMDRFEDDVRYEEVKGRYIPAEAQRLTLRLEKTKRQLKELLGNIKPLAFQKARKKSKIITSWRPG